MKPNINVSVIIPSLNPDEKIIEVVEELEKAGFDDIIIVDDGSSTECKKYFSTCTKHPSCTVLVHEKNKGKGAALKTAFRYFSSARTERAGVITVDDDGQHHIFDITSCAQKICEGTSKVVLGVRDFSLPDVPWRSRMGNKITSGVFKLFCGLKISDTQTGLRAIPYKYIEYFLNIKGDRYEYETNMLLQMKTMNIPYSEIIIETVYINENKKSHFRMIRDSVRIYSLILKFLLSSALAAIIDNALFFVGLLILEKYIGQYAVILSSITARIISSAINLIVNKKRVFKYSGGNTKKTVIRYYIVAAVIMLTSTSSVYFIKITCGSVPIITTLIKIAVDTVLFILSFRFQREWVFNPYKENKQLRKHKQEQVVATKKSKKKIIAMIIRRTLLVIVTLILFTAFSLYKICNTVTNGSSVTARNKFVLSMMQASATKWVPELFLEDEVVNKIIEDSEKINTEVISLKDYKTDNQNTTSSSENNEDKPDKWENAIDGMLFETINGSTYKAYVLLIKDPARVSVGVSSSNFASASRGTKIFDIAKKYDAVAAINGGEFWDAGGKGTGAAPMGLSYSHGKCVWNDSLIRTFIGFDKNNTLIVKEAMIKEQADQLGIRDAVCFQRGNMLIERNGSSVKLYYADNNTGTAQRTAIGQCEDGTIILVVTDGRTASSLGATRNDMINIMVSYGAVSAAMLDGGSSALMYYEKYYEKYDINTDTLDKYQVMGLVNNYKAFTTPRRMPTYFIVSRG